MRLIEKIKNYFKNYKSKRQLREEIESLKEELSYKYTNSVRLGRHEPITVKLFAETSLSPYYKNHEIMIDNAKNSLARKIAEDLIPYMVWEEFPNPIIPDEKVLMGGLMVVDKAEEIQQYMDCRRLYQQ